jgi:uncharacterized repeat protein (TIGR01451 family)
MVMAALLLSAVTWRTLAESQGSSGGSQEVARPSVAGCATPKFTEAAGSPLGAGDYPAQVVVGDFDNDGAADLAVANAHSDDVTIRLGDGTGAFPTASTVGAGDEPYAVAVGDFNRDDKQDLAVANFSSDNVTIRLGDGTGAFPNATTVNAGDAPFAVAVGDFNRDDKQDLAVANHNSNNVTILLGDGAGAFPNASTHAAGLAPKSVAVGDFNRDGKQDLAVANQDSGNATILLGDGAGAFPTASTVAAGHTPSGVAVGEFNNDGKPDLAVSNTNSRDITIRLGDGAGGFPIAITVVNYNDDIVSSVIVGDFNHDGKQDIAATLQLLMFRNGYVAVWFGDGTGVFFPNFNTIVFEAGVNPLSVAAGDFNNDGRQDLVASNSDSDTMTALLNTCDATPCSGTSFKQPVDSPLSAGTEPFAVVVGDFNRDGKDDLATANFSSGNATILFGDGTGAFPNTSTVNAGGGPFAIAVGDFNRDGKPDLAIANRNSNNATIRLGDGAGGFPDANASTVATGFMPDSVAVGDFNRDDKQDLAVANAVGNVTILLGDGTGAFPISSTVGAGSLPYAVAVGDFNRDGKDDLAIANRASDNVTIRLGDGAGGFPDASASTVAAGDGASSVAVGDFNHDDKQDLAVVNYTDQNVTILLGDGTGAFPTASTVAAGVGAGFVTLGDFNRDGHQDLAVANQNDANVTIRLGDGTGAFPNASTVSAGNGATSIAIGDFNNNGRQDLAIANYSDDNVTIQLNGCNLQADLSVTKTDNADPIMIGQQINYQLLVKNNGPNDASGLVLTEKLPLSATFISATPSVGSCSRVGATVTCRLGNLANGATVSINVIVKSGGNPGTITNMASVTANESDPAPANNKDSETTRLVGFRSFAFTPPSVTGGCRNSTGKLMFTSPAPAGVLINFTDNSDGIAPIASVVTLGGELSMMVTASTRGVGAEQLATVTASTSSGPNSIQARLKLLPVRIASLTFNRNPVKGGLHLTGRVTLACVPDRDVVVKLTTNRSAAKPDVNMLTIHARQLSAVFGITTLPVSSNTDAVITATANGLAKPATLHLIP